VVDINRTLERRRVAHLREHSTNKSSSAMTARSNLTVLTSDSLRGLECPYLTMPSPARLLQL
jgi:hypothetical protein